MRLLVCTGSFVALELMEQMRMRDADARGTLDDEMERMILDRKPDGPLACFRWGMWDAGAHVVLLGYGNEMCGET